MFSTLDEVNRWARGKPRLWLFLDYDGTLADFPAAPGMLQVQPEIINLVQRLSAQPHMRVAIISGRKLPDIRDLLPVEGVFLAGVYGLEIQTPDGDLIHRGDYGLIRPALNQIKLTWEELIAGREGFFLEDKGWSLALHVLNVEANPAIDILSPVQRKAFESLPEGLFRQFVDRKFLEIAPYQANKGATVCYLLGKFPFSDAYPVFIGDDDKDIEAFDTIHAFGGINILVSDPAHPIHSHKADYVLKSPQAVRRWLTSLLHHEQEAGD
jgi:trehalose 6-phosphate phosphatase